MTLNHIEKVDAMITINTGRISRKAMPAQKLDMGGVNTDVTNSWMLEGHRGGCYVLYFYNNGTFRCFSFDSMSMMNDLARGKQELVSVEK